MNAMSTSRYFDRICAIVLIAALIVTVLFMNGQAIGIELVVDADSEAHSDNEYFTENDLLSDWDTSSATYITLEGDTVSIKGNNAYEYDGNVVISGSGKFVITGTLDDGYITVDANANSKVWILLQNVDITCSDNACLRVDEADKVFLTLAGGTENTLTGGEELSQEALDDGTYGVIFAHDDLTINGSGSLQINAGYKHGIKANDDLVITGGTITIDAVADGIHVNDSFRLRDASVSITAGDDGILTENEESFFYLESGEITLNAEGDGIHSNGDVIIAGGSITMDAGDDGIHADGDIEIEDGVIVLNSCYEGIEGATITVSGGEITIYPTDDGFNASSGSSSEGGMFQNGGGNPGGMGGPQTGMQPPEGMEMTSEQGDAASGQGGTMPAMPDGDGTPPAMPEDGGTPPVMPDGAGTPPEDGGTPPAMPEEGGMPAQTEENTDAQNGLPESQQDAENFIRISGGTITVINENGNDADGLDSNGDILITGGDIRISLADNGTNSALDAGVESGGVAQISGGTVIACGSSSMAESFDGTSTQCSILYNISSGVEAGTCLKLEDEEGNEILSWEVPCGFSSAVLSSPEMETGETYTIIAGESEETITLSEMSASFGDAQSTMFSGNMNWGGMQRRESSTEDTSGESESSQMPGPGQSGERPGFMQGEAPEGAQGEAPEGAQGEAPEGMQTEAQEGVQTESTSGVSYDADVWVLMLLSSLALAAGLIFARKYKRR